MVNQTVKEEVENLFSASSSVGASVNVGTTTTPRTVKPINKWLVIGLFAMMLLFPLFKTLGRIF